MKENRRVILLTFLALVLSLSLTSCADPEREANAKVRVVGTASSVSARSISSQSQFESADIYVAGDNITDQLVPSNDPASTSTSSNDVEFEADVPVVGNTVRYRVEPRPGYVFDEWELRRDVRRGLRERYQDRWIDVLVEIQNAIKGDKEEIEINPDYIEFIRPTFDRGYYFYSSAADGGDGSSENPFNNLDDLIKAAKERNVRRDNDDDDELTIKMRTSEITEFDLSNLYQSDHGWDDDDIELKLLGGYDGNWTLVGRTKISEIKMPSSFKNEMEIEFRNIEFESLNHSFLASGDDDDLEFRNCLVNNLNNPRRVVNGLIVKNISGGNNNLVFVNSDAPYNSSYTYIHSIIRQADDSAIGEVKGKNNIIVFDGSSTNADNIYIPNWGEGYKTEDESLIAQLTQAIPLNEEDYDDDRSDFVIDEDALEEDIEGRERYLIDDDDRDRGIKVSYGPYEYQRFYDD